MKPKCVWYWLAERRWYGHHGRSPGLTRFAKRVVNKRLRQFWKKQDR